MTEAERKAHDKAVKAKCDKAYRGVRKAELAIKGKAYREANREKLRLQSAEYYAANKQECLAHQKQYYQKNKEHHNKVCRAYILSKPIEYRRKISRESAKRIYRKNGGDKWGKKNPEKRREIARNYARRLLATPKGRLNHRMSTAIRCALQMAKAGRSWESLVGYTIDDLRRHIESKFKPGMNWDRLMAGQIEIDHIIPKAKFNYSKPEDPDFKRCWALENLQPLWTRKNREKHAQILGPSQIPLGI